MAAVRSSWAPILISSLLKDAFIGAFFAPIALTYGLLRANYLHANLPFATLVGLTIGAGLLFLILALISPFLPGMAYYGFEIYRAQFSPDPTKET